jgi:cytochrome b involved in lipid metabolism
MKKSVAISLFIFFVVVTAVLVAGLVFYQNNYINNPNQTANNINPINTNTGTSSITLDIAEVSKHNNINDCYMLIDNKVYNITSYFGSHPGGDRTMVPYCGKDSTQGYDTKGNRGNSHSSYAASLLTSYYIGDLNQTISQSTLQQNVQKTNSIVPASGGGDYEDD